MTTTKKSSFCGNGACVEVAMDDKSDKVIVYDLFGNRCIYTFDEWRTFISGVKNGEFDV